MNVSVRTYVRTQVKSEPHRSVREHVQEGVSFSSYSPAPCHWALSCACIRHMQCVCVCVCVCILTSCLDTDAVCKGSTAKAGHVTTIYRWPKYVREVAAMKDEARVPVRGAPDQRTPPTRSPKHQHPIPHQQHHTTTTRPVPPPRHACRGTLRERGADSLLSVDRAKWFSPAAICANAAKHSAT
jgi:hypothetical protein